MIAYKMMTHTRKMLNLARWSMTPLPNGELTWWSKDNRKRKKSEL